MVVFFAELSLEVGIDMIFFDSDDEVGIQYQLKHILTMELPLELQQVQLGRHI